MIYLVLSIVWIIAFMTLKKCEGNQKFWRSLAFAGITYECYLCAAAGIMTVLHVPVDIYTISVVNLISIVCISIYIYRKKEVQRYYIDIADTVFVLLLAFFVLYIFFSRFTMDLAITFETSDPGVHLKSAMNFLNKKSVSGMYIGQVVNGLFIQSLFRFFSGEFVYKSFVIQYGINFFMSGFVFWAVVQKYRSNIAMRLLGYAMTAAYMLGYPYNDMLYGFVYLQMTVTVGCFVIGMMQDFVYEKVNIWIWGVMIGLGCLGISIGYTLFAPPIYIGVLCFTAYKAQQEGWLRGSINFLPGKKFIACSLNIFLLPTFLTLWFILILPKIAGSSTAYGTALLAEGAIYRNLYSDFLLFGIPAAYGVISGIKRKKVTLLSFLLPIFGTYYFLFLYKMLTEQISTYYFYKLNYLLWMFICVAFVMGMEELVQRDKILFVMIVSGILFLTFTYITDIETALQRKKVDFTHYVEAPTFFRIYACNEVFKDYPKQMDKGLVEVSGVVNELGAEETVFVGYWQDLFWYEALTNQRFSGLYNFPYAKVMEMFQKEEYGQYAVIQKPSNKLLPEELEKCEQFLEEYQQDIQSNIIYENDYAYVIKR